MPALEATSIKSRLPSSSQAPPSALPPQAPAAHNLKQYFKSSYREYFMFYIYNALASWAQLEHFPFEKKRAEKQQLKVLLHLQLQLQQIPSAVPSISGKRPTRLIQSRRLATPPHWSQLYAQMNFTRLKQASTARTQPLDTLQPVLKEPPLPRPHQLSIPFVIQKQ